MTQLFERCEKATQGGPGGSNLSEGFDEDILTFVRQQEQNGSPFFIDDPDVDGLVSTNRFIKIRIYKTFCCRLNKWLCAHCNHSTNSSSCRPTCWLSADVVHRFSCIQYSKYNYIQMQHFFCATYTCNDQWRITYKSINHNGLGKEKFLVVFFNVLESDRFC